jgi:transcriptional regulator with XRE-family HTH domain
MKQVGNERAVVFMTMPFHGKTPEQRREVLAVSDVANEVCRELNVDLLRPWVDAERVPTCGEQDQYLRDRCILSDADCLLALVWNSEGSASQVEIAVNRLMPIIYLVPTGSSVSPNTIGSLGLCLGMISYSRPEEIRADLRRILSDAEPQLFARRHARPRKPVGERIQQRILRLRQQRGMSREELARRMGCSPTLVVALETLPDGVMNASVTQIYALAEALDVPAGWILEPDEEASLRALEEHEIGKLCLEEDVSFRNTLGFLEAMRPSLSKGLSREELRRILRWFLEDYAER